MNVNRVVSERSQCDRELGDDIRQKVWCKQFFLEMHQERCFCFPSKEDFICEPLDCAEVFTLPIATGFQHGDDACAGPNDDGDAGHGPRFWTLDDVKLENVEVLVVRSMVPL